MRVIAGTAKGVRLATVRARHIRPTLDRVRESLFNILGSRVPEGRFLDLFAGTGAIGIEALSRGALFATFVDSHGESLDIIRENLRRTRLAQRAECVKYQLPRGLDAIASGKEAYAVVFADPPYDYGDLDALAAGIWTSGLMASGGLACIQHARRTLINSAFAGNLNVRRVEYGETALTLFS